MEHITLTGTQPGTAILRFSIDGSRFESMYGPFPGMPGSMTFDFRLYDPETISPGDP